MIELMVAIVVAAILLAIAVPSFETTINSGRLSGASNELMAGVQAARMEAIRSNRRTLLCLSPAPNAATPSCNVTGATGWVVFRDADNNGNPATADVVRVGTINPKVQIASSPAFGNGVMFHSDGLAYQTNAARTASVSLLQGAVAFCIPTKRPPQNVRYVNVTVGRASIKAANGNAACAAVGNNP